MKRNNVKLKISKDIYLSIAQHFDDNGEMLCNEMAIITEKGVSDQLPFYPRVSDFMKTFAQIMQGESIDRQAIVYCETCGDKSEIGGANPLVQNAKGQFVCETCI